ncbi:hypothetical protein FHS97_001487 [Sphingomonas endophytica]|uniref:Uncharacterized protein n=1 Tax=Sphingomonas endophytica TaxID=869719 RepID=A0ABR6N661_9SPHN|nr:hypothetical protein [Sphingomonas endophytica]
MSVVKSDHPVFLTLRDYEWSAISSIATALAVIVALVVPLGINLHQLLRNAKVAADADRRSAIHVAEACHEATAILMETRRAFNISWKADNFDSDLWTRALRHVAIRAARRSEMLRIVASQPDRNHLSISCALASAEAMDIIASVWDDYSLIRGVDAERGLAAAIEYVNEILMAMQMDLNDLLSHASVNYNVGPEPRFFTSVYDQTP